MLKFASRQFDNGYKLINNCITFSSEKKLLVQLLESFQDFLSLNLRSENSCKNLQLSKIEEKIALGSVCYNLFRSVLFIQDKFSFYYINGPAFYVHFVHDNLQKLKVVK